MTTVSNGNVLAHQVIKTYPTFRERMDAFLTVLCSEPRMITVIALDSDGAFSGPALISRIRSLAKCEPPFSVQLLRSDCFGTNDKSKPALMRKKGLVRNASVEKVKGRTPKTKIALTEFGKEFGVPVAALGLHCNRELSRLAMQLKDERLATLERIIGRSKDGVPIEGSRPFVTYRILKHLAQHPDEPFGSVELKDILGLKNEAVMQALETLGQTVAIEKAAPMKRVDGERKEWGAPYDITSHVTIEDAYKEWIYGQTHIGRPRMKVIVDTVNRLHGKRITSVDLAKECGESRQITGIVLRQLARSGKIKAVYNGRKSGRAVNRGYVKANQFTLLLWDDLLAPIEEAAFSINQNDHSFGERIRVMRKSPVLTLELLRCAMDSYKLEGANSRQEDTDMHRLNLIDALFRIDERRPRAIRPVALAEIANSGRKVPISSTFINRFIEDAMARRAIERKGFGVYQVVDMTPLLRWQRQLLRDVEARAVAETAGSHSEILPKIGAI